MFICCIVVVVSIIFLFVITLCKHIKKKLELRFVLSDIFCPLFAHRRRVCALISFNENAKSRTHFNTLNYLRLLIDVDFVCSAAIQTSMICVLDQYSCCYRLEVHIHFQLDRCGPNDSYADIWGRI